MTIFPNLSNILSIFYLEEICLSVTNYKDCSIIRKSKMDLPKSCMDIQILHHVSLNQKECNSIFSPKLILKRMPYLRFTQFIWRCCHFSRKGFILSYEESVTIYITLKRYIPYITALLAAYLFIFPQHQVAKQFSGGKVIPKWFT